MPGRWPRWRTRFRTTVLLGRLDLGERILEAVGPDVRAPQAGARRDPVVGGQTNQQVHASDAPPDAPGSHRALSPWPKISTICPIALFRPDPALTYSTQQHGDGRFLGRCRIRSTGSDVSRSSARASRASVSPSS